MYNSISIELVKNYSFSKFHQFKGLTAIPKLIFQIGSIGLGILFFYLVSLLTDRDEIGDIWIRQVMLLLAIFFIVIAIVQLFDNLGFLDWYRQEILEGYTPLIELRHVDNGFYYENATVISKMDSTITLQNDRVEYLRATFYLIIVGLFLGGAMLMIGYTYFFVLETSLLSIFENITFESIILLIFPIYFIGDFAWSLYKSEKFKRQDPRLIIDLNEKVFKITSAGIKDLVPKEGHLAFPLEKLGYLEIEEHSGFFALTIPKEYVEIPKGIVVTLTEKTEGIYIYSFYDEAYAEKVISFLSSIVRNEVQDNEEHN